MPGAIYAEGLVKTFGEVRALDGVDLDVPEGTVLGLLGPNGAGKTTAVRVLTTLLKPDSGKAVVAGIDVLKHPNEVRRAIGLSGQFAAVDEYLTGRENLRMVGQLYQMSGKAAKVRAAELLERFNLGDAADRTAKTYSGGMRRRLDLAAALVVSPPVMFMDEPTTGLDPATASSCGGSSRNWSPAAPPCCSPLSTWRRPTTSRTTSAWSTTARSSPAAPPTSSRPGPAANASRSSSTSATASPTPARCSPASARARPPSRSTPGS